jgi:hypothetical protein
MKLGTQLRTILGFLRQLGGYWQLETITRLMPGGWRVGVFTYFQDKLIATIHISEQGQAVISPVEWSEHGSWSHKLHSRTVRVDQVPDALWHLIGDPEAFKDLATTCIRCHEVEGVSRDGDHYYCDACEAKRQEEHKAFRHRVGWDKTEQDLEYERLLKEREHTPQGIISGCFQIPWGQLEEIERDGYAIIVNKQNGHAFKVPCGQGHHFQIHEIDADKQPVTTYLLGAWDIDMAVQANGEFVTEIEKPPYL